MDCKTFSNLLDAWLDGELSPEDQARLEAHAAECPDCAALLTLSRDCRELEKTVDVPAAFSSAWREKIRREAETVRRKTPWRGILTAAAALVFVVGGTLATRSSLPIERPVTQRPAAEETAVTAEPAANGAIPAEDQGMAFDAAPLSASAMMATGLPAAFGTSAPTWPPALEMAGEAASKDVPGMKTAESLAVTNVQFNSMRQEEMEAEEAVDDFAVAEESVWAEEAACEEPAREAEIPAQEAEALADDVQPADGTANEDAPDEAEGTAPNAFREIGLILLCALPWIAVAAAVLLILRRKNHQKRKE